MPSLSLFDSSLAMCHSCTEESLSNTHTCKMKNKVYSILQVPILNYQRVFYNSSIADTDALSNLWKRFTDIVLTSISKTIMDVASVSPNGVRVQYIIHYKDEGSIDAAPAKDELVRDFEGRYLKFDLSFKSTDFDIEDVLLVLRKEEEFKISCGGVANGHSDSSFSCLLASEHLVETKNNTYVERLRKTLEVEYPGEILHFAFKGFWVGYSYTSYNLEKVEVLCPPNKQHDCQIISSNMLHDVDSINKTLVHDMVQRLNSGADSLSNMIAQSDVIKPLQVGAVEYGGRHLSSCDQKISGSQPYKGKCMCQKGEYEEKDKGCVPCPPNHYCDMNIKTPCEQSVASNNHYKWHREDQCFCRAGFFSLNSTCTRCSAGYFCPGAHVTDQQKCPDARNLSGIGAKDEHDCIEYDSNAVLRVAIDLQNSSQCNSVEYVSLVSLNDFKKTAMNQYGAVAVNKISVTRFVHMRFLASEGKGSYDFADLLAHLKTSDNLNSPITLDSISLNGIEQPMHRALSIDASNDPVEVTIMFSLHERHQLDLCLDLEDATNTIEKKLEGSSDFASEELLVVKEAHSYLDRIQVRLEMEMGATFDLNETTSRNLIVEQLDKFYVANRRHDSYAIDLSTPGALQSKCVLRAVVDHGKCTCNPGYKCFPDQHSALGCIERTKRECVEDMDAMPSKSETTPVDLARVYIAVYISYIVLLLFLFLYFVFKCSALKQRTSNVFSIRI